MKKFYRINKQDFGDLIVSSLINDDKYRIVETNFQLSQFGGDIKITLESIPENLDAKDSRHKF